MHISGEQLDSFQNWSHLKLYLTEAAIIGPLRRGQKRQVWALPKQKKMEVYREYVRWTKRIGYAHRQEQSTISGYVLRRRKLECYVSTGKVVGKWSRRRRRKTMLKFGFMAFVWEMFVITWARRLLTNLITNATNNQKKKTIFLIFSVYWSRVWPKCSLCICVFPFVQCRVNIFSFALELSWPHDNKLQHASWFGGVLS